MTSRGQQLNSSRKHQDRGNLQGHFQTIGEGETTMALSEPSANPNASSPGASPRFLSLGEGSEVLQVALCPGDAILANERAFVYRGLGLQQELQPTGPLGRALGW